MTQRERPAPRCTAPDYDITKRGNKYLRKLLIHGARAALPHIAERDTALGLKRPICARNWRRRAATCAS
jgi:transposase